MTTDSPAAVLYRSDGYELAVVPGSALPAEPRAILEAGSDGTNAQLIKVDSSGRQVAVGAGTAGTPAGGLITIQGDPAGTPIPVSGSFSNPATGINNNPVPAYSIQMGGTDGTNLQAAHIFDLDTGGGTQYTLGVNLRLSASGGSVEFGTATNPIRIDPTGSTTQPVSGTVTANIGTSGALALDATLTGGTQRTKVTDGTNNAAVKAASTAPVASDPALVVAISPNSNISTNADGYVTTAAPSYTNNTFQPLSLTTTGALRIDGSAVTQPVSGTVAATQSGTWTVQPGNTANTTPWLTTISQGGNSATVTASNALKVDGSAVTQPVSGTVTANIGTTNGLALDATLAKLTIAQSTALGSNTQALVGGSVTTAAPTYTTGNINPLSLTTAGALRIDGSGVTQPVSGTVAATQSGTWNINNISGTISLPTGAATEASLVKLTLTQGSTTSGQSGTLIQGAVTTAAPTYTTGQTNPLSLTTAGALRIDGSATTQPVSGTVTSNQGTANTLANAWSTKITDATNGPVAVKAASTAAVATDPALVVAVSPNNSVTVTQATASNLNAQVVGPGASGAAVSGNPVRVAGSDGANTRNIITDTTGRQVVVGAAADGAAVTGNPVLIGGTDGTNAQTIATNTNGAVLVDLQSSAKSVYGAAVRSLSPPATPTDMVTITGSGTKTIRVLRIILSAIQTTGASQEFLIIKRSTANTGGTSSTATNVPFATSFAAATATVRSYTANPTTGTAVGTINVVKFFVPAGGTAQRNDYVFDFSNNGLYPGIVLSGTSEVLALNFNGAALPGGLNVDCTIEWSEE